MATEFTKVADLDDVAPGELLGVEVDGRRLCLANVDGEVCAFVDTCSHREFPLSAGELEDDHVVCAWHGARFDVHSGQARSLPAIKPIRTFEVKVEDGAVYVAV